MNITQNYAEALNMADTIASDATNLRSAFDDMQAALANLGNEDVWSGNAASEFKQSWDSQVANFDGFVDLLNSVKTKITTAAEALKTYDNTSN